MQSRKCAATRKAITEECVTTRKAIKEEHDQIVNLTHKLDDLLILRSKKFYIYLPVEPLSKPIVEPILVEAGILPVTSGLQQELD